ncbi:MAG: hypothetical protein ACR2MD_01855 [Aridibacter sp.]
MKEYQIKLSKEQLIIMSISLDLLCRLQLGQIKFPLKDCLPVKTENFAEFENLCAELKKIVFPELFHNESYSIGNGSYHAKIAYEMDKMIRLRLWTDNDKKPSYSVDGNAPLHYSKEGLIEVEKLSDKIYSEPQKKENITPRND